MEGIEIKEAGLLISDWFSVPLRNEGHKRTSAQAKTETNNRLVRERKEYPDEPLSRMPSEPSLKPSEIVNPPLTFELKNLDHRHPYLKNRGLLPETIDFFGLGYCSRGLMKGRIVIPVHDLSGRLVAYAGRAIDEQGEAEGKYKLPPKFQKSLVAFNLHRAKEYAQERGLVLVEGYFSLFNLWQAGFKNVAALMGSSMSEEQEELIIGVLGPDGKAFLLFDNDEAGLKCQEEVIERLAKRCFVKAVELPEGVRQVDEMGDQGIKDFFGLYCCSL